MIRASGRDTGDHMKLSRDKITDVSHKLVKLLRTSRELRFKKDPNDVRLEIVKGKWPDILKAARQAKVQFWKLGGSASSPDADTWLTALYGPNREGNLAKFDLPAYNKLYEQARTMPDSPERTRIYQQMTKLVVSYVPWRVNTHRIRTSMWYPQLVGFTRSPLLSFNFWKYVDIDLGAPTVASR